MSRFFLNIINMSISASYIVIVVILLRLILKKAPKWITVVLWGIVALRLVFPISIESVLSLIPNAEPVSPEIMLDRNPQINTGIPIVNQVINPIISYSFTPDPATSANPLQLWIPTFAAFWILGMIVMLVYTVISYVRVKRKVGMAVMLRDNIYLSENVASPFVLGIIKPKIYLPFNMNEKDMSHVLSHETAHIRRKDHLWKPLGFILLTIHWFNPLMWLGYVLLCRDIELACDEKVIGKLENNERADYSEALLSCSINRRMIAACPLAFGEVGVKNRVKSVLNYKKPAFWLIIAAITVCLVVAVCFLTNPFPKSERNKELDALAESYPSYFGLDVTEGLDVYVWQMAKDSYSFGLLPHLENPSFTDLMELRGISAREMRIILSSYDIEKNKIFIIPWQNPLSSYIGDYWIVIEGEDPEVEKAAYIERVKTMLFGPDMFESLTYDTAIFDIDKDGKDEICSMSIGPTSGLFTFTFSVHDKKTGILEYENVIHSQRYALSFKKCIDGVIRVQGATQGETPETHLFDISVVDGNINLTEDGTPIGVIGFRMPKVVTLIYDAPQCSSFISPSNVPSVEIEDNMIYTIKDSNKKQIGTVGNIKLNRQNFDELIKGGSEYSKLGKNLRKNNKNTFEVTLNSLLNGTGIYYIMEQKNGEMLIVYGHYDHGVKTNEIRFIYSVKIK